MVNFQDPKTKMLMIGGVVLVVIIIIIVVVMSRSKSKSHADKAKAAAAQAQIHAKKATEQANIAKAASLKATSVPSTAPAVTPTIVNSLVANGSLTPTYTGSFYLQFTGNEDYITDSGTTSPSLSDAGKFTLGSSLITINGVQYQGILKSDQVYGDQVPGSTSTKMVLVTQNNISTGLASDGTIMPFAGGSPKTNYNSIFMVNAIAT